MSFLNAEWRKLAIANYEIDPEILKPFIPPKTELDLWNGISYVSLVGFMFVNTKLLGIPIPFHRNFEEVNLRFYVRYKSNDGWRRGVVFIKEIVPKPALTFVANTIYKEHYETMKMSHVWKESEGSLDVAYEWWKGGLCNKISVVTDPIATHIEKGSESEFITEHYWGYTKVDDKRSFEYEVTHPKWECYKVKDYSIEVDYGLVYGHQFSFLNEQKPKSVMLAEGSEITVEGKTKI